MAKGKTRGPGEVNVINVLFWATAIGAAFLKLCGY